MLKREHVVLEPEAEENPAGKRRKMTALALGCAGVVAVVVALSSQGHAARQTDSGKRLPAIEIDEGAAEDLLPTPTPAPPMVRATQATVSPEFAALEQGLPPLLGESVPGQTMPIQAGLYDPRLTAAAATGPLARVESKDSALEQMRDAQKMRWEEGSFEQLQAAMQAPIRGSAATDTGSGRPQGGVEGASPAGLAMLEQSLATLASGQGRAPGGGGVGGFGTAEADQGRQAKKLAFFQEGGKQLQGGAISGARRRHASPFTLLQGAFFSASLETPINSELPGQIRGRITQNVYDSATGSHLLIPSGCQVVGTYSSDISQGQERAQVAWTRLNFPDGSFMDLGSMSGGGVGGLTGLKDRVNRHVGRVLGAALLMSAPMITYELTRPTQQQSIEGAVHRGVGNSILQAGSELTKQAASIPPTIEIRRGTRMTIHVNKDVVFERPYEDGLRWRRR